jgi:hypothetical protein
MERRYNIFDNIDEALAHVTGDFFRTGWKDISRLYNSAVAEHLFAKNSDKEFDHMQDLLFLYIYLFLLNWERKDIYEITGSLPSRSDLFTDYALDDVRKYFACNFIEIIPLLAEFDTAIPHGEYDGVGYMYIQPGDTPEFVIS